MRISKDSNDLSLNLAGFRGGEIRAIGQVACKAKEGRKFLSSFWQKPFGLNFSGMFFSEICYFLKQNMNMSYLNKNYQATFIEMLVKAAIFSLRHEGRFGQPKTEPSVTHGPWSRISWICCGQMMRQEAWNEVRKPHQNSNGHRKSTVLMVFFPAKDGRFLFTRGCSHENLTMKKQPVEWRCISCQKWVIFKLYSHVSFSGVYTFFSL